MSDSEERWLLRQRLENEEGTLEEQEAWVTRLQALDPYFYQSDHMLQLEDFVQLKRRVQVLREQLGTPLTREQLVALVRSIDYSKLGGDEDTDDTDDTDDEDMDDSHDDIHDLEAREMLFAESVPHPDARELVARVWLDKDMTAEEVVDVALAWKVPDIFCLPGPLHEDAAFPSELEEHGS